MDINWAERNTEKEGGERGQISLVEFSFKLSDLMLLGLFDSLL